MGPAATKAIRRVPCGAALLLATGLAACAPGNADKAAADNLAIVAAPLRPAALPSKAAAPAPAAAPMPIPTPTSLSQMRPHKSFIDPPLPPELRDDHGLIPLPPPPGTTNAASPTH